MTSLEFRRKVDEIGTAAIAARAGITRRSVERARVKGGPARGKAGEAMLEAIEALSAPVPASAPDTRPDDAEVVSPEASTLLYRAERALLMKQRPIRLERQNSVEAAELVPVEEVRVRVLAIATELRRGHETIGRAIERAAGENRDAVREAFDTAFGTMRERIEQALRGT